MYGFSTLCFKRKRLNTLSFGSLCLKLKKSYNCSNLKIFIKRMVIPRLHRYMFYIGNEVCKVLFRLNTNLTSYDITGQLVCSNKVNYLHALHLPTFHLHMIQ